MAVLLACAWTWRGALVGAWARRAAARAGLQVSFDRVEIEGLSTLTIRDVRVAQGAALDLACDRAYAEFDVWRLARGDLGGLTRLELDRVRGHAGPFPPAPPSSAPAHVPLRWPTNVPVVRATLEDLSIAWGGGRGLRFRAGRTDVDGSGVRVAAGSAEWVDGDARVEHPLELDARYEAGRFDVERATWDPRLVLERGSADLTHVDAGRLTFTARARLFDARLTAEGDVDRDRLDARLRFDQVDLGALVDAFLPETGGDLRGRASGEVDARVPIEWPGDSSGRLDFVVTDLHAAGRDWDRVEVRASGTLRAPAIDEALVVHGANAARIEGVLDRPFSDLCGLPQRVTAFVSGRVDDVGALLRDDVGLKRAPGIPDDAAPSGAQVTVSLAHGLVDGVVTGKSVDVHDVVAATGASVPIAGRVDVRARVWLPLLDARSTVVTGSVAATDVTAFGRRLDAIDARVGWRMGVVDVEDAYLVQGPNTLEIPFATIPTDPCELGTSIAARWNARILDLESALDVHGGARELEHLPEHLPEHRLEVSGHVAAGVLVLEQGEFESGANRLVVNAGNVPVRDDFAALLHDEGLDVGFGVDCADLGEFARLLPPEGAGETLAGLTGRLAGRAALRGSTAGPRGHLDVTAHELSWREARIEEAAIEADLDEHSLTLSRLAARSSLGTVQGGGCYEFEARRFVGVRLDADVTDLARLLPDAGLPAGRSRLVAELDGAWPDVDGRVECAADDLRIGGLGLTGVALRTSLHGGRIDVDAARATTLGFAFSARGELEFPRVEPDAPPRSGEDPPRSGWFARTLRARLDAFDVSVDGRSSSSSGPMTVVVGPGRVTVANLRLAGDLGLIEADVDLQGSSGHGRVRLLGVEPSRWPVTWPAWLPDGARGDATIEGEWSLASVRIDSSGRVESSGVEPTRRDALDWSFALRDGVLGVQRLLVEHQDERGSASASVSGSGACDALAAWRARDATAALGDGPVDWTVSARADHLESFAPASWGLAGRGRLDAHWTGAWRDIRGRVSLTGDDLTVPAMRGTNPLAPATTAWELELDGDGVSVTSGTLDVGVLANARASGRLRARVDARALARGDTQAILDAPLAGRLEFETVDLGPIAARLPALRRTGGRIHAWLDLAGTARTPTVDGRAVISDGEIRTSSNLPSIAGVDGEVRLSGSTITLEGLAGEMGGAPFRLSGSVDAFTSTPRLDLRLVGDSLLLWREGDVTVRADADLALVGPTTALALKGRLAVRDARYTKKVDFLSFARPSTASAPTRGLRLFSLEEAPFSTMTLDVAVTTGTPFAIANNVVRGALSPDLQLVGTGLAPDLRGVVLVEPSRVLLPSGALKVKTGRIEFRPDRPGVPFLDLQATARLQGYDVDVSVTGPSDNPRVDLSSVPPLPREDLVLLVITGRPPGDSLTLAGGQRAAVDVAVYIARDVAAAWLEGRDEDDVESLAERLEVVVGADRTRSGADSVLVRMRLTRDTGERGSGVYLTGERDLYDFYNFGVRLVVTFP